MLLLTIIVCDESIIMYNISRFDFVIFSNAFELSFALAKNNKFHELYFYFYRLLELHLCNYNTVFQSRNILGFLMFDRNGNKCSPKNSCQVENLDLRARASFFGVDPLFPGWPLVPFLEQAIGVFVLPGLWLE